MAHDVAPFFLRAYGALKAPATLECRPFQWRGLRFANRFGIAGGVDKNAENLRGWWALGAGFVEVGTITPRPQGPNPGKILRRDRARSALWNRMGFPSHGIAVAAENLRAARPFHTPVFVNIGKNRATPNERAAEDYARGLRELAEFADAFVINLSSPNTAGLRDLLRPRNLDHFLAETLAARPADTPVLLKLSPDMAENEIRSTLDLAVARGVDGFVLTNTTLAREAGMKFPAEGGVSGAPLAPLSLRALRTAKRHLGDSDHLLVSVGGVLSAADAQTRLDAGADLVQVYTALVYHGPNFFRDVCRQLRHNE